MKHFCSTIIGLAFCLVAAASDGPHFEIRGTYSVDKATHLKQMADCKRDIARFRRTLSQGKVKRNDEVAIDSFDAQLIRANSCVAWASEPLGQEAQAVVEEASSLNMDIAEYFRYNKGSK